MVKPTLFFLDIAGEAMHDFSKAGRDGRVLTGGFDGQPLGALVGGQILPDGITVFPQTKRIYWSNMGIPSARNGHVKSCNLDGSDVQTVIATGTGLYTPKQLAINNENQKLYVCDREGLRTVRCNLDGSSLETLIESGDRAKEDDVKDAIRWCTGIAIDPRRNHLYWSQKGPSKGGQGRIFRASLEIPKGEQAGSRTDVEILFQGLPEVVHLDLDVETAQLYWTDHGEVPLGNSINRAYVGPDRKEYLSKAHPLEQHLGYSVLVRQMHEAIGIQVDGANSHIYAADMGGSVYRFSLDGSGRTKAYEYQGVYTGVALAYLED